MASLLTPALRAGQLSDVPRVEQIRIGLAQQYKVGYWTPVWLTLAADRPWSGRLELVVPDGDGVKTHFAAEDQEPLRLRPGQPATVLRYVKFGRIVARLEARLIEAGNSHGPATVQSIRIPRALPSSQKLIVTVGGDVGVAEAVRLQRRVGQPLDTTSCRIESADQLPDHWIGLESVDRLVLTTSNYELIEQLSAGQLAAIERWVQLGGQLVLCLGRNGQRLFASDNPLKALVPGRLDRVAALEKTVELETFAKATERLDSLPGASQLKMTSLHDVRGRVLVQGARTLGQGPIVVRSPYGLGQVAFVAVDLDLPPLSAWQGRPRMVARILEDESLTHQTGTAVQATGKVAHEGYDDMVGQLRAALDHFGGVTLISFTLVAALTVLYVLLIGPADYWLLKKLIGRMEWTWVTFPISVVLFCLLAFGLVRLLKSRQLRINQVEVIDLDASSSLVRGTMWAHVYSPANRRYNLSFAPAPARPVEPAEVWFSWQGLPGSGLGGMNSRSSAELLTQPYSIVCRHEPSAGCTTAMQGLPIHVAASKTLAARWWGRVQRPVSSQLWFDRADDSLHGQFTNPWNVELTDCLLAYGNWIYRLGRKLGPGETIDVRDQMSERSLNLYLTRRSVEERTAPWNQASLDVPRIVEVMMHYAAAGGPSYTGLAHQYQGYVDLSSHLRLGRAVLTGWTSRRAGILKDQDRSLAEDYDRQWTFYRVVFPVETRQSESVFR